MIGRIKGVILEKQAPYLLVDVNGIAYEINAPMTTFYRLPDVGKEVLLHTHFVVREDAQLLYGFFDQSDRALFRLLVKINGVGPKLALAILSGIETSAFVRCVNDGDSATLVKVPGVGKKTAERLVIEMRDKIKDWQGLPQESVGGDVISLDSVSTANSAVQDAESALLALGYKQSEASKAVSRVAKAEMSSEEIIRQALKAIH